MKTLYLAWQEPFSRCWFTVGRLTFEGGRYRFIYTRGSEDAKASGFQGLPAFPDLEVVYESGELFALFANRLMPRSRPDYPDFVRWLSLPEHEDDPFALLARSGGQRATGDTIAVFPCPEKDDQGLYYIHFFAHGLRHLAESSRRRVEHLQVGELLLLMPDVQNNHDAHALMLRTADSEDLQPAGWVPRSLARDVKRLLDDPAAVRVTVERINPPPAPIQFRLLCNLTVRWPDGFFPLAQPEFQPLAEARGASEAMASAL